MATEREIAKARRRMHKAEQRWRKKQRAMVTAVAERDMARIEWRRAADEYHRRLLDK